MTIRRDADHDAERGQNDPSLLRSSARTAPRMASHSLTAGPPGGRAAEAAMTVAPGS
jgi:hypothetical protein